MDRQDSTTTPLQRHWTAAELRRLPAAERDAILLAQAEIAEPIYRNNPELTAFEAFDDVEKVCGGGAIPEPPCSLAGRVRLVRVT